MLIRTLASIPLGPVDAWFASGLARLAPRVRAAACVYCEDRNYGCGTCSCPQGPTCGQLQCDGCGTGDICYCYCPPPPIC